MLQQCDSVSLYGFLSYTSSTKPLLGGGDESGDNLGWSWHDWLGARPTDPPTQRAFPTSLSERSAEKEC